MYFQYSLDRWRQLARQICNNYSKNIQNQTKWNRDDEAQCVNQECCGWRAASPAEPPWVFTHTRHSADRGVEFHSVWPLPGATGPLCTHYRADLVNWTNHLWLTTDSGLVIQQRQRSFFIIRYDIAAWILEAVCRGSVPWQRLCMHIALGVRRGAGTVIAHHSFRRIAIGPDCMKRTLTGKLAPFHDCKCAETLWKPKRNSRAVWAWVYHHLGEWVCSVRIVFVRM